jgi:hypothetical protein
MPTREPTPQEIAEIFADARAGLGNLKPPASPPPASADEMPEGNSLSNPLTSGTKLPGLSGAEAIAMAQSLEAAGVSTARIEEALKADGFEVADGDAPLSAAAYSPNYPRAFTEQASDLRKTDTELRTLAADMKLTPQFGNIVLEHLAEIGPKVNGMSDAARAEWMKTQRELLGPSAAAIRDAATKVLDRSPSVLAKAIKGSAIFESAWLLRTLATAA